MRSKKDSGSAQPISGERPAILWISPTSGPKLPQRGRCRCSGGPCAAGLRRSRVVRRRPSASPGAYVAGLMYAQARPGRTARADAPEGFEGFEGAEGSERFEGVEGPGSAPRGLVLEPHGASSGPGLCGPASRRRRAIGYARRGLRFPSRTYFSRKRLGSAPSRLQENAVLAGQVRSRTRTVRCEGLGLRCEGGDEGAGLAGPGDGELVPGAGCGHVQQRALPQEGIGAIGLGVLLVAQRAGDCVA